MPFKILSEDECLLITVSDGFEIPEDWAGPFDIMALRVNESISAGDTDVRMIPQELRTRDDKASSIRRLEVDDVADVGTGEIMITAFTQDGRKYRYIQKQFDLISISEKVERDCRVLPNGVMVVSYSFRNDHESFVEARLKPFYISCL